MIHLVKESQTNTKERIGGGPTWTVVVYHIRYIKARIIWCLYGSIEKELCTED